SVLPSTPLVAVQVEGWRDPAWAAPAALDDLGRRGRHRTTLLSPFDSLVWDRRRTARLFGMDHRLEAYTPAPKRVHGYFAMPVLHRGRLVARVDPGRDASTLVAKRITLQPREASGLSESVAMEGVTAALDEAAQWVGCDAVRIDDVRSG
ncbi:MAG: DNA glycosylase AlkZ-like family protein, partial [Actinomycetes bacterium]